MRKNHQVAKVTGLITDMIGEQGLWVEAERSEHRDRGLLVSHHLDHHFREAEIQCLEHGMLRERSADTSATRIGIDDNAHLSDVARPTLQLHDGHVADHTIVLDRDRARGTGPGPSLDYLGRINILLEERAIALRNAGEELFYAFTGHAARAGEFPSSLLGRVELVAVLRDPA